MRLTAGRTVDRHPQFNIDDAAEARHVELVMSPL
jgi:hypothetical protein